MKVSTIKSAKYFVNVSNQNNLLFMLEFDCLGGFFSLLEN